MVDKEKKKKKQGKRYIVKIKKLGIIGAIMAVMLINLSNSLKDVRETQVDMSYTEFRVLLDEGQIEYITIFDNSDFCLASVKDRGIVKIPNPRYPEFKKDMMETGVQVTTQKKTASQAVIDFIVSVPLYTFLILIALYLVHMVASFSESIFKGVKKDKTITFDKVAGLSEVKEEIQFAVDILKNNNLVKDKGARGVKGILLHGAPGTGKTLIARAIAGEAGVPFITASGSDFSNMYIGVGAQRVNQLYSMAKENAPCVVFIDEIDALAKKRGYGTDVSSEFSSTLNALLHKMDGIETNSGILFVAATNMIDVIDPALLRSGRFDRQIEIGPPTTKKDRDEIIAVHLENKKLKEGLTIDDISKFFFGMTGADIEGVLNESVIESIRLGTEGVIDIKNIDSSIMKLVSKGVLSNRVNEKERELTALHEAGHAIIAQSVGRKLAKVSIASYGSFGGITLLDYSTEENMEQLSNKTELTNGVRILYGGLCAEEIIMGEHSSGCSSDLKRATKIITKMITEYGMGESLLIVGNDNPLGMMNYKNTEERQMALEIKSEVIKVLTENKESLLALKERLLEEETVYYDNN